LGAIIQGDLHVGETVAIDLPVHELPFSTVAVVRHTSTVRSGFEFVGLIAEERKSIINAAKRL
jgi:hypothetical protein